MNDTMEDTFVDIVAEFYAPEKCESSHTGQYAQVPCGGTAVARFVSCDINRAICLPLTLVVQNLLSARDSVHSACGERLEDCWRIEGL